MPGFGVSLLMDDSENGGNFSIMHKVHAVRKLVQQCPPDWLLDERELTRIFSDTLKRRRRARPESVARGPHPVGHTTRGQHQRRLAPDGEG